MRSWTRRSLLMQGSFLEVKVCYIIGRRGLIVKSGAAERASGAVCCAALALTGAGRTGYTVLVARATPAEVAQWQSVSLPRRRSRVQIPSSAPALPAATWPSGKARVCKTLISGSNPLVASRDWPAGARASGWPVSFSGRRVGIGRRSGLKHRGARARAGSSPAAGTSSLSGKRRPPDVRRAVAPAWRCCWQPIHAGPADARSARSGARRAGTRWSACRRSPTGALWPGSIWGLLGHAAATSLAHLRPLRLA